VKPHNGIVRRAAILIGAAGLAFAQSASTISLSNSVELRVEASLGNPTGQEKLTVELARASGNSFYRIFRDHNNLVVFAYELVVDRSAGGTDFRFTARPAMTEFAARFPNADAGKPVPSLSSEQRLRAVRSGEKAEVGLFEIPGMGLRVSDSVHVQVNPNGTRSGGEIRFTGVQVSLNGNPLAGETKRAPVSGRYAMFYVPGKGGYFFSTDAPPGRNFLKAGSVDRARLRFNIDNDAYEVTAAAPILEHSDSGEIWVFHDPAYRPSGNWTQALQPESSFSAVKDEFFAAAADSLNWWFR